MKKSLLLCLGALLFQNCGPTVAAPSNKKESSPSNRPSIQKKSVKELPSASDKTAEESNKESKTEQSKVYTGSESRKEHKCYGANGSNTVFGADAQKHSGK